LQDNETIALIDRFIPDEVMSKVIYAAEDYFYHEAEGRFEVPASEGYQLYSAILDIMRESDEAISKHAHDSPISSISIGMLQGRFGRSARPHHKTIDLANTYPQVAPEKALRHGSSRQA
jgi:hypothetical protein